MVESSVFSSQVLLDVAKTYYAGDTAIRQQKTAAIGAAYAAVGIQ